MTDTHALDVTCALDRNGHRCDVKVGTDAGATQHTVRVTQATLDELAPGSSAEALVRASFEFLLEREPRESILRSFDLPVIGRYFAEYPDEIASRLS